MSKPPIGFFDNERVTHRALMDGQGEATRHRIMQRGEEMVLLLQDTTEFDFSHHPQTGGMGSLENEFMSGFLAHSTLAVSGDGMPLGLLDQQVWVRAAAEAGKRHRRHQLPIEAKESYKWIAGLPPPPGDDWVAEMITVCDREADIYEFLDEALGQGIDFIVRAARDRKLEAEQGKLFTTLRQMPVQQRYKLRLQRHPDREAREAVVELRYGTVTLVAPKRAQTEHPWLTVQGVEVYEPHPPPGQKAVHWRLLTSRPVETPPQAHQVVEWYATRWLIERFHYVLKSGCRLEERQLREQPRLERLLAVFNLVAWNLLWLTYQARQTPDAVCMVVLEDDEWQALYAHTHQTMDLPPTPPTLGETTHWIAQLGGFLDRKGDGEPGVKVLWRGWTRLQDIVATWRLFHPPPTNVGNV